MERYTVAVGLNDYPGSQNDLKGCLKDIDHISHRLVQQFGSNPEFIRQCIDRSATKAGIMSRFVWLRKVAKPNDQIVVYYSGHGSQIATRTGSGEIDGLMECICPYNFDGTVETAITDKDLYGVFGDLDPSISLTFFFDSCHSGGLGSLTKGWSPAKWFKKPSFNKSFTLPQDSEWRNFSAKQKGVRVRKQVADKVYGVFLEGCTSAQTSADAYIGGVYQGAFSWALNTVLDSCGEVIPAPCDLIPKINKLLFKKGYEQTPQAEGVMTQLREPLMGGRIVR
jgi:hypothetical protein